MNDEQHGYQDLILQHAKAPVGQGELPAGCLSYTTQNQLCGDVVTVYLAWTEAGQAQLGFSSSGCSLCRASASILVAAVTGLSDLDLKARVEQFRTCFPTIQTPPELPGLPAVRALYDLRRYPSRQRCVLLPWDALTKLLYT